MFVSYMVDVDKDGSQIRYLSISNTSETRYPGIEVDKYKQSLWLKGRMAGDFSAFFLK